jgi:hypothetical protein
MSAIMGSDSGPEGDDRDSRRGFAAARWHSFVQSVSSASNAEKVRAVLAITLVGVLVALQFAPSDQPALTTAAETLAISVVAFYFGLHSGSSTGARQQPPRPEDEGRVASF